MFVWRSACHNESWIRKLILAKKAKHDECIVKNDSPTFFLKFIMGMISASRGLTSTDVLKVTCFTVYNLFAVAKEFLG